MKPSVDSSYNKFGELTAVGAPIAVGVADANGMAIMVSSDTDH
jgi:hypothetical protein